MYTLLTIFIESLVKILDKNVLLIPNPIDKLLYEYEFQQGNCFFINFNGEIINKNNIRSILINKNNKYRPYTISNIIEIGRKLKDKNIEEQNKIIFKMLDYYNITAFKFLINMGIGNVNMIMYKSNLYNQYYNKHDAILEINNTINGGNIQNNINDINDIINMYYEKENLFDYIFNELEYANKHPKDTKNFIKTYLSLIKFLLEKDLKLNKEQQKLYIIYK